MTTKETMSCLILYFLCYMVLMNVALELLSQVVENVSLLYMLQFSAEIILLCALMFLCKKLFKDVSYGMDFNIILSIPAYYIMMIVASSMVTVPIILISDTYTSNNQIAIEYMFEQNLIYSVFAVAIFAPIVEELIFRGVIYKNMRRIFTVGASVAVSSSVFALMHFIISLAMNDFSDIIFLPTYIVPSIFLCLIYEKYDNIFAPIFLHLANNSIGLIAIIWGMM